jgi:hypothetical protein
VTLVDNLVDNSYDVLMGDTGPAARATFGSLGTVPAPQFEESRTCPGLMAEHGFSALVTVRRGTSVELPTLSRAAPEGEGFTVIERRRPSLLLDGSVPITGEVDRTTDFERGPPFHDAWRDGLWEPDPLVSTSRRWWCTCAAVDWWCSSAAGTPARRTSFVTPCG